MRNRPRSRLLGAATFLGVIVFAGASIYYQIGGGRWSWWDCAYMTVITIATVGYGEVLEGMDSIVEARIFTVVLIVLGSGTLVYFVSNLTAVFVEGDLRGMLMRRRMQAQIDRLEGHVVVCGVGSTGLYVVKELLEVKASFVAVDRDEERLQRVIEDLGRTFPYVVGDATDDHTLEQAGIARARGLVAALHEDRDNLFATITARALNANARIVAKGVEAATGPKLKRAGADTVVSPNEIGGLRLADEMVRPAAVQFLDRMLREVDLKLRIEEVHIPERSKIVRRTLAEAPLRNLGALVLALKTAEGKFVYNPSGSAVIEAGATLIVIARAEDVDRIRKGIARDEL